MTLHLLLYQPQSEMCPEARQNTQCANWIFKYSENKSIHILKIQKLKLKNIKNKSQSCTALSKIANPRMFESDQSASGIPLSRIITLSNVSSTDL